jgi:hypothetical protein
VWVRVTLSHSASAASHSSIRKLFFDINQPH